MAGADCGLALSNIMGDVSGADRRCGGAGGVKNAQRERGLRGLRALRGLRERAVKLRSCLNRGARMELRLTMASTARRHIHHCCCCIR